MLSERWDVLPTSGRDVKQRLGVVTSERISKKLIASFVVLRDALSASLFFLLSSVDIML